MAASEAGSFFNRYKDYVLFNKNLIISGVSSFFVSALAAELYALHESDALANAIVALAAEYAIYIPLFGFLFYSDNKYRYVDPMTGKRDSKKLRNDVKKLFTAFSISEIIYSLTRTFAHYQLLQGGMEPYQASMIGSLIAWSVFLISINAGIKFLQLFKKS